MAARLAPAGGEPGRVLLVQIRRLGDVVLTAALLDDLRRALPGARLDFLVGAAAAPILEGHPHLSERIVLDERRPLAQAAAIRARGYDWVIDVQSNPRTAMLTRATGARVRAGWDIGFWAWTYTHTMPRRGRAPEYVLRERQRFLEMLGVPIATPARPRLHLSDAERAAGRAALRAAGVPDDAPAAGLLLATRERAKDWRVEAMAALAEALADEGVRAVALRAPGDEAYAERFRALAPRALEVPVLAIRPFMGAIAACSVFVSGDTGPAHMAIALDVPTVTIFGPTDPVAWSPGLPTTVALRVGQTGNVPTKERQRHPERDYTAGVTPEMVLDRVRALLRARAGATTTT